MRLSCILFTFVMTTFCLSFASAATYTLSGGENPGSHIECDDTIEIVLIEGEGEILLTRQKCPVAPVSFISEREGSTLALRVSSADGRLVIDHGNPQSLGFIGASPLWLHQVHGTHAEKTVIFPGLSRRGAGLYERFLELSFDLGTPLETWCLSSVDKEIVPPLIDDYLGNFRVEGQGMSLLAHPATNGLSGQVPFCFSAPESAEVTATLGNWFGGQGLSDPLWLVPVGKDNEDRAVLLHDNSIALGDEACPVTEIQLAATLTGKKRTWNAEFAETTDGVTLRFTPAGKASDVYLLSFTPDLSIWGLSRDGWNKKYATFSLPAFSVELPLPEDRSLLRAFSVGKGYTLSLVDAKDPALSRSWSFDIFPDSGTLAEIEAQESGSVTDVITKKTVRESPEDLIRAFGTSGEYLSTLHLPVDDREADRIYSRWCEFSTLEFTGWAGLYRNGVIGLSYRDVDLLQSLAGVFVTCFETRKTGQGDDEGHSFAETEMISVPDFSGWASFDHEGLSSIHLKNTTPIGKSAVIWGIELLTANEPYPVSLVTVDLKARYKDHGVSAFFHHARPFVIASSPFYMKGFHPNGVSVRSALSLTGAIETELEFGLEIEGVAPDGVRAFVVVDRLGDDAYMPQSGDMIFELTREDDVFTRTVRQADLYGRSASGAGQGGETLNEHDSAGEIYSFWYVVSSEGIRYPGQVMDKRFSLSFSTSEPGVFAQVEFPPTLRPGETVEGEVSVVFNSGVDSYDYGFRLGLFKAGRGTVWLSEVVPKVLYVTDSSKQAGTVRRFSPGLHAWSMPLDLTLPEDFWHFRFLGRYAWVGEIVRLDGFGDEGRVVTTVPLVFDVTP